MSNIAIVVTATSYTGELNKLKACQKDGLAVLKLLKSNNRFDDILYIHDEENGVVVNDKIFAFLKGYEGKAVDEVLFYFSGHGEFIDSEFYYLMRDFRSSKRRQTSIINSQLDDAVRSVEPRVYAKIVDACHSGISYIKDASNLGKFINTTKPSLKDLYFLFSSLNDQSSWQSDNLSYFTSSIIDAVIQHKTDALKYKDVINYVVDEFETNGIQTPFFVNQGSLTDVFCEISSDLKKQLAELVVDSEAASASMGQKDAPRTISELVRAEAEIYCTKEEVTLIVSSLVSRFNKFSLEKDMEGLYDLFCETLDMDELPSASAIGTWLKQKKDEGGYFAKAVTESQKVEKRVPKDTIAGALASIQSYTRALSARDYTTVEEWVDVVKGFKHTTSIDIKSIMILAENKHPNIMAARCFIAPIVSRTHLRLFYAFAHYEAVDWTSTRRVGRMEWLSTEAMLKNEKAISSAIDQISAGFRSFIEDPIRSKFKIPLVAENLEIGSPT